MKTNTYDIRQSGYKFDWITACSNLGFEHIVSSLSPHFKEYDTSRIAPLPGYQVGMKFFSNDQIPLKVFRAHDHCQILSTGHHAEKTIPLLRSNGRQTSNIKPEPFNPFPYGTVWVTRIDACVDIEEEGYFDDLKQPMIDKAIALKLPIGTPGDWYTPGSPEGRTLNIGNMDTRHNILRMYEKGKQLKTSFDWTRLEVEYRPQRSGKDKSKRIEALYLSPEQVFTHHKKLNQITKICLLNLEYKALKITPHRPPSDYERALFHMTKQYAAVLNQYINSFEDDSEVISDLRRRIEAPF